MLKIAAAGATALCAGILCAAPFSPRVSPDGGVSLALDSAGAYYHRHHYRYGYQTYYSAYQPYPYQLYGYGYRTYQPGYGYGYGTYLPFRYYGYNAYRPYRLYGYYPYYRGVYRY